MEDGSVVIILWIFTGLIAGVAASFITRLITKRAIQIKELAINIGVGSLGAVLGGYISLPLFINELTLIFALLGAAVPLLLVNLYRNFSQKIKLLQISSNPDTKSSGSDSIQVKKEILTPSAPIESKTQPPQTDSIKEVERPLIISADKAVPSVIFISYRRSDAAHVAGRIYDRLVDGFGRTSIFKDVDSIPLGLDFKEYLGEKVGECDVLLAIIGDRWLDSKDSAGKRRLDDPADFVRIEIESALTRKIPVIPILVDGAAMPSEVELPNSLKKLVYRNGITIRPDPDFHRDMDRLISALTSYVK